MLKRIDTAVFDYVTAFDEAAQARVRHLRPEGRRRRLLDVRRFLDDIQDQIDEYAEKIKSGEIKVPTDPVTLK